MSNIIQNVGVGTTALIYVENVKTFFDPKNENLDNKDKGKITIISQEENKIEKLENAKYYGDFGKVTSITPTFVETSRPALAFDLEIEDLSSLSNPDIVEDTLESTSLSVGDYFVINNSNVGAGVTSLRIDDTQISVGSSFIDNVYQVFSLESVGEQIFGSVIVTGNVSYSSPTTVESFATLIVDDNSELIVDIGKIKILTKVSSHDKVSLDLLNTTDSNYYGNYSWGKITAFRRPNPKSFEVKIINNSININSSPVLRRSNPLKYSNYLL